MQNEKELKGFNAIPKEQVFIHLNDNFLLSGEYLYYKFYGLDAKNSTPSKISKIGYVILLGEKNSVVFQHKIKLIDGQGQGDFFVPSNIKTGHYKLIGFTQWMRNQGESSFFITDLVIVNPYRELPEVSNKLFCEEIVPSISDSLVRDSITKEKYPLFQFNLRQRIFKKRELVQFEIRDIMDLGLSDVSISVRKKEAIAVPFQKKSTSLIESNFAFDREPRLKTSDSIYLPELRGELISGHLISKTTKKPIVNKSISLSVGGNQGLTKVSRSSKNGSFFFNLDKGHRDDQVLFKLLDNSNDNVEIKLDSTAINTNIFNFKELFISSDLNSIFEQRSIYNQIENAFFEQKLDSIINSNSTIAAYNEYQEKYKLDDYTRFSTLRETIIEIIEDVFVKKRKGRLFVQVRGKNEFFIDFEDEPLVLVDHMLIKDVTSLFEYDIKKIKQIGISRDEFYFGSKKYQGIFSITTIHGDYPVIPEEKSWVRKILGPIALKQYFKQDYRIGSKSKNNNADFRQQLVWLPKAKIDKKATFEFYTSDNLGVYEISVEGFTEKGVPISITENIKVE